MNGSYNNYTLSPKQAQYLIDEVKKIASNCKVKLENTANDFLKGISSIWADDNAVKFATSIGKSTDSAIQMLARETNSLILRIYDFCDKYAAAGNTKNTVSLSKIAFSSGVNVGVVKNTFDGDRYGFADNGSEQHVLDLLNDFGKGFKKSGEELLSAINHTNAFGNLSVKNDLAKFASVMDGKIFKEVLVVSLNANKSIQESKRKYANISNSVGGNNSLSYGGSNSSSYGSNAYSSSPYDYSSTKEIKLKYDKDSIKKTLDKMKSDSAGTKNIDKQLSDGFRSYEEIGNISRVTREMVEVATRAEELAKLNNK